MVPKILLQQKGLAAAGRTLQMHEVELIHEIGEAIKEGPGGLLAELDSLVILLDQH